MIGWWKLPEHIIPCFEQQFYPSTMRLSCTSLTMLECDYEMSIPVQPLCVSHAPNRDLLTISRRTLWVIEFLGEEIGFPLVRHIFQTAYTPYMELFSSIFLTSHATLPVLDNVRYRLIQCDYIYRQDPRTWTKYLSSQSNFVKNRNVKRKEALKFC